MSRGIAGEKRNASHARLACSIMDAVLLQGAGGGRGGRPWEEAGWLQQRKPTCSVVDYFYH